MDAFAILDLPVSATLGAEQVRVAYFAKSKGAEADHAQLNAAYELLLAPEKRLKHLLDLGAPEEAKQWRTVAMSEDLMQLFMALGRVRPEAEALIEKRGKAQSALAKALLEKATFAVRESLEGIGTALDVRRSAMETTLSFTEPTDWQGVAQAQAKFSYLARWQAQVRELLLKLM